MYLRWIRIRTDVAEHVVLRKPLSPCTRQAAARKWRQPLVCLVLPTGRIDEIWPKFGYHVSRTRCQEDELSPSNLKPLGNQADGDALYLLRDYICSKFRSKTYGGFVPFIVSRSTACGWVDICYPGENSLGRSVNHLDVLFHAYRKPARRPTSFRSDRI
ncbi:hypothetical protein PTI98_007939 [Pleurotus ostreatus]|nr:hypothetical protein PTI98_007939 [Pleurotus ostreatus]